MVDYLKCKSCNSKFQSPMQAPPGAMVTQCPNCGKNVDIKTQNTVK